MSAKALLKAGSDYTGAHKSGRFLGYVIFRSDFLSQGLIRVYNSVYQDETPTRGHNRVMMAGLCRHYSQHGQRRTLSSAIARPSLGLSQ